MEEKKKKILKVTGVSFCLVLAVVITFLTRSRATGLGSIKEGDLVWVMCSSPDCQAEYQIGMKKYFEFMKENVTPSLMRPPMLCQECDEETVLRAVKCENCDMVFLYGGFGDFMDRCPECGFSKIEESRNGQ